MSLGAIRWFLDTNAGLDPRRVFDVLARHGLLLHHPVTGGVRILEDDGQREEPDAAEVVTAWSTGTPTQTQLWRDADTDVALTIGHGGGLVTADLDGLTVAEAEASVFALVWVASLTPATVGVVVDSRAFDRDAFWIAYFSGHPARPDPEPELLLTRSTGPLHYQLVTRGDSWLAM